MCSYPRSIHVAVVVLLFLSVCANGQEQQPAVSAPRVAPQNAPQNIPQVPPNIGPEIILTPSGEATLARAKENFSSLSLVDSGLHAEPPLLGSREQKPEFIRELWQVKWRPNDAIDLYVIRPRNVKNPPVVLYLYGFPTDTDRFKDDRYCQRVVRSGVAAVGFVSALTGQRDEYRPPKQWFVSELQEALGTTVHDVQMILNYLDSRGDLDMSRVGMLGQGSGGAIAILAAAADPRIKALDLLNPWGDWPDWLSKAILMPQDQRANYLKPDFLKRVEPLEPVHYLPSLNSLSIRIQFVDEEGNAPKQAVSKFEAAAPPTAKIIHYPTVKAFRDFAVDGHLFEWIATELKPQKETTAASVETKTTLKEATAQAQSAR